MNGGFINWNILALNMADELEERNQCVSELLENRQKSNRYNKIFSAVR